MTQLLRLATPEDPVVNHSEIMGTVEEMAAHFNDIYRNTDEVVALTVLEGARPFADALIPLLETKIISDTVQISSMEGTTSTGQARFVKEPTAEIEGKDVLVIEDLLDKGVTLSALDAYLLNKRKARSVRIAALGEKVGNLAAGVQIRSEVHTGIKFHGQAFLVGFGLDWNNRYRSLPYITTAIETRPGFYEPAVNLN